MGKTDHFPSPFVAQKRGVLISSLMLLNPIFCPRYSLFDTEQNYAKKFLSLHEIVIFYEFLHFGFLTPRPSERKSGTSHTKPAHRQRATVYSMDNRKTNRPFLSSP